MTPKNSRHIDKLAYQIEELARVQPITEHTVHRAFHGQESIGDIRHAMRHAKLDVTGTGRYVRKNRRKPRNGALLDLALAALAVLLIIAMISSL